MNQYNRFIGGGWMNIGFIGLGAMGKAMAANLLKEGHHVRVWNRTPGPAEELEQQGAQPVKSPEEAFAGDAVISMLADDDAVRAVFVDQHLIENAPKTTVHVNMATVSVSFSEQLSLLHRDAGVPYVAAPVFGRTEVALAGRLNILAAGDAAAIDLVQPLFDVIGQKTYRLGDEAKRANVVKIAGNFMIAAAIESLAESVAMAEGHGLSAADALDILVNTIFSAPVYKNYGALIAEQRYEPAAFRLSLGLKDVLLALSAGESVHVPMPFASVLRDHHLDAIAHGDGDKDWAALANVTFRRAGL